MKTAFSYFNNGVYKPHEAVTVSLKQALSDIETGRWRNEVETVRYAYLKGGEAMLNKVKMLATQAERASDEGGEVKPGRALAVAIEAGREAYAKGGGDALDKVLSHDSEIGRAAYAKGGKDAADHFKLKLPIWNFSGVFCGRSALDLVAHSGLICVDLDQIPNVPEAFDLICADPLTLAAFRSPSGTGLKVVYACDPKKDHEKTYLDAEFYVLTKFKLRTDKSGKDVNRACFVSYDPDAYLASAWPVMLPTRARAMTNENPRLLKQSAALKPRTELTPGDDYNARGDWRALLINNGWIEIAPDTWGRAGKNGTRGSATWDKERNRLHVFSPNTSPFEPGKNYAPFALFALLEYGGNFGAAEKELASLGYGFQSVLRAKAAPEVASATPTTTPDARQEPESLRSAINLRPDERTNTAILNDIHQLTAALVKFRDDRDWSQFHDSKNLASAICIEAAELNELFLWKTTTESDRVDRERLKDELADVLAYSLLLAQRHDIDLKEAVLQKIDKNAAKYPIEKSRETRGSITSCENH